MAKDVTNNSDNATPRSTGDFVYEFDPGPYDDLTIYFVNNTNESMSVTVDGKEVINGTAENFTTGTSGLSVANGNTDYATFSETHGTFEVTYNFSVAPTSGDIRLSYEKE